MGITPSQSQPHHDQLYLPADTFRLCHPATCFCHSAHSPPNRSKYVYVDRSSFHQHSHNHHSHHSGHSHNDVNQPHYYGGGTGSPRQVFRDPMELLLERGGSGGGGFGVGYGPPGGWGLAGVDAWRKRDWEVMNRLLGDWVATGGGNGGMQQGNFRGGGGGGWDGIPWAEMVFGNGAGAGFGGGPGPMGFQQQQQPSWAPGGTGPLPPPPPPGAAAWQSTPCPYPYPYHPNAANYDPNFHPWQGDPSKRDLPPNPTTANNTNINKDPRFTSLDEKLQLLTDILFGSEAERQEKRVQEQLLKRFTPMVPELAKLIALQQQQQQQQQGGGGGLGPGGGGGGGGVNGMGAGMNGFAAGPAAGMGMSPPIPMPMPMPMPPGMGMGMGTGIGGPIMGGPYGMGGGGGDPRMMGSGGGGGGGGDMGPARRRPRGGGGGGGSRRGIRDYEYENEEEDDFGGFGSRGRGSRRRRRGDDWGGDDLRLPRGPSKGPRRPRPDDGGGPGVRGGGGGGGGGSTGGGGAVFDTFNDNARFRTAAVHVAQPSHWASPQRETAPQPQPPPPPPQPQPIPAAPPNRILTPIQDGSRGSSPPIVIRPFGATPIPQDGAPPYRPFDGSAYDSPHSPMYHPGALAGDFADERQLPRRDSDFRSEADFARPRVVEEEEKRGGSDGGGPVGRSDAL